MLFQKAQHVVPAVALLVQGVGRLTSEGHGWSVLLGAAEVGTSALVIGAFALQIRAARTPSHGDGHAAAAHHGVDWVDLFLGGMLAVEVWAHWHETGHVKRPTVLLAVAMVAIGLLHGRIAGFAQGRRSLRIDDDGLRVSPRPFRHFTTTWAELAAIDLTPREARLRRRDGTSTVVDLADLRNAADVRAALEGARLRLAAMAEPAPGPVGASARSSDAAGLVAAAESPIEAPQRS